LQWNGSFYAPNVTPTPATATWTGVNWLHSSITSTILLYYAISFEAGKSELLPLPQATLDANIFLGQDYGH
jgi:starch-binding outer membrane protein, SusD/RagB family